MTHRILRFSSYLTRIHKPNAGRSLPDVWRATPTEVRTAISRWSERACLPRCLQFGESISSRIWCLSIRRKSRGVSNSSAISCRLKHLFICYHLVAVFCYLALSLVQNSELINWKDTQSLNSTLTKLKHLMCFNRDEIHWQRLVSE